MIEAAAVHLARVESYPAAGAALGVLLDTAGVDFAARRVVIEPNWVMHENASGAGLECLVTHPTLIEAAARRALEAGAESVILADAPLQSCDFARLAGACGFDAMLARLGARVSLRDLRLVARSGHELWSKITPAQGRLAGRDYVLFDLGQGSRLEPVTDANAELRVTAYDPEALTRTHRPGRHQYLIAREILEADLVINLPKLKTHKKAGLTGALKNMVGANGHKSYLPHHRKGAGGSGGDCYPHAAFSKSLAEFALDRGNASDSRAARFAWGQVAAAAIHAAPDRNLEGSWHGNDTLWRTVLDIQTIVHYGTADGALGATPQRRIVHVTDAVVAGQGDGPLAPEPYPAGFLMLAGNAAAADWIASLLLGLDPRRIPSVREAFAPGPHPLASFAADEIEVRLEEETLSWREAARRFATEPARLPEGWTGHIEWRKERTAA